MSMYSRTWVLDDIHIDRSGDGRTVTAYAAVFDAPYEVRDQHGHYMESISRSAFTRTLSHGGAARVMCLFNHGLTVHGAPDGKLSVPLGTPLEIKPDGRGLLTVTRYNRGEIADLVLESIRNGDIRSQSFRGRIFRSSPDRLPQVRGGALPTVVRHELGLSDYGPTPVPVNVGAEILAVRSVDVLAEELEHLDDDARDELIEVLARHLPGKHRQGSHGNRFGTSGDRSSGLRRKGVSKLDPPDGDGGESVGSTRRLPGAQHSALESITARTGALAGTSRPVTARELGLRDATVSSLDRQGYIDSARLVSGDRSVTLTDKGHDYLAGVRGDREHGDLNAKIREIGAQADRAEADASAARDSLSKSLAEKHARLLTAEWQKLRDDRDRHLATSASPDNDLGGGDDKPSKPAGRTFTTQELSEILGEQRGTVTELRQRLEDAGATREQSVQTLRDLDVEVDTEFSDAPGAWNPNNFKIVNFAALWGPGRKLQERLNAEENARRDAERRANLREMTPKAYARLLGTDGQPAAAKSKAQQRVFESMRDAGWTLTFADGHGWYTWSSPDGSKALRLLASKEPKLYDAKSNAITLKKALEVVAGAAATSAPTAQLAAARSFTGDLLAELFPTPDEVLGTDTATPADSGPGAEDSPTAGHSGRLTIRRNFNSAELIRLGVTKK